MEYLADLHVHSKYAMATSPRSDLDSFSEWAKYKGIDILGTGDFCHPLWFKELKEKFKEKSENGIYSYKNTKFVLQNEVSTIYYKNGKCKKIHHILYAPSLEVVEQIIDALGKKCDLKADGRPILKISSPELVETIMNISKDNEVIPGHCFTPWFGVFGSKGGFDSIEDCYEDQT
ncbi:MAG: DNA helicase UvrD, partial [Candidatus Micrarchaeia archaeon]